MPKEEQKLECDKKKLSISQYDMRKVRKAIPSHVGDPFDSQTPRPYHQLPYPRTMRSPSHLACATQWWQNPPGRSSGVRSMQRVIPTGGLWHDLLWTIKGGMECYNQRTYRWCTLNHGGTLDYLLISGAPLRGPPFRVLSSHFHCHKAGPKGRSLDRVLALWLPHNRSCRLSTPVVKDVMTEYKNQLLTIWSYSRTRAILGSDCIQLTDSLHDALSFGSIQLTDSLHDATTLVEL